jgi:hypothetical protein
MELCISNGSAQDEAEPKPVRWLASSLGARRTKSFFQRFKATGSQVTDAQITAVGFVPCNDQSDMDVEKLIACVFMESGEPGPP